MSTKDLYLDLMGKVIANTIYCDPNMNPKREQIYIQGFREEGRDWPAQAHSMIGLKRLNNLRDLCSRAIAEGIAGDFVETGIWRGGACILMRSVLKAHAITDRRVFCCDSFDGLPKPNPEAYPKDINDKHHTISQLAVPQEQVMENFSRYDLLDDQVVFVKGFFKDTLHLLETERVAVLRLDGDMYESTMQAFEALYDKVSDGGFIIVDDYGAVPGCKSAVHDFLETRGLAPELHSIDWTGIWWQKTAT